MNAAVAHHDVRGPQTGAELRCHREQPDSRSAAGGVLTGSGAATADKTLHEAVELLQGVEGTHQLGRARLAKSGGCLQAHDVSTPPSFSSSADITGELTLETFYTSYCDMDERAQNGDPWNPTQQTLLNQLLQETLRLSKSNKSLLM